jgi:hypothetical protein
MTNTTDINPHTAGAPPAQLTVRVLYNDAVVNRQSDAEEAFPGKRMSEIDGDLRKSGAVMPAFSRMLSGDSCYHPGDPLLEVWVEDVEVQALSYEVNAKRVAHDLCERFYCRLNAGHPEGFQHRSMSMGDIVVIGETAWVCETIGFEPADISSSDIRELAR